MDNIRLWEADVLKTAIQNLQAIGQYYEFSDVDVDRYRIGDARRQVMISAREVDPRNLDASAQTWVNLYLAYTHGYGVVAAQVNRAETSGLGLPCGQRLISGRRPSRSASHASTSANRHRTSPGYVVVDSRQPEVGSPSVSGEGQASFRWRRPRRRAALESAARYRRRPALHGPEPAHLQQSQRPLKDPVQPGRA